MQLAPVPGRGSCWTWGRHGGRSAPRSPRPACGTSASTPLGTAAPRPYEARPAHPGRCGPAVADPSWWRPDHLFLTGRRARAIEETHPGGAVFVLGRVRRAPDGAGRRRDAAPPGGVWRGRARRRAGPGKRLVMAFATRGGGRARRRRPGPRAGRRLAGLAEQARPRRHRHPAYVLQREVLDRLGGGRGRPGAISKLTGSDRKLRSWHRGPAPRLIPWRRRHEARDEFGAAHLGAALVHGSLTDPACWRRPPAAQQILPEADVIKVGGQSLIDRGLRRCS